MWSIVTKTWSQLWDWSCQISKSSSFSIPLVTEVGFCLFYNTFQLTLFFSIIQLIFAEIVNIIGNFSPNIEVLHLDVTGACTGRSALLDNEFLSAFQFSGLRSLHIYTAILNLSDGSFLPLVI